MKRGKRVLRVQSVHKIEYGKVSGFAGVSEAKIFDLFGVLGIPTAGDNTCDFWVSKEDFESALEDLKNPEEVENDDRVLIQQSLDNIGMTWEKAKGILEAYWAECEPEDEGMYFSFINV